MKAVDGNKVSALFGFLFALFTMKESLGLGIGGLHKPGPGLFPFFGGILLAVFSAILLVKALIAPGRPAETTGRGEDESTRFAVYAFLGILVYALILEGLGFLFSTFLFVIFFLTIFEQQKWWVVLLTAAIVSSASYVVFVFLLQSDLPKGLIEQLL
jgi:putative tricarboxylic transport membrane protein